LSGEEVVASGAISNPGCLEFFKNIPELQV